MFSPLLPVRLFRMLLNLVSRLVKQPKYIPLTKYVPTITIMVGHKIEWSFMISQPCTGTCELNVCELKSLIVVSSVAWINWKTVMNMSMRNLIGSICSERTTCSMYVKGVQSVVYLIWIIFLNCIVTDDRNGSLACVYAYLALYLFVLLGSCSTSLR